MRLKAAARYFDTCPVADGYTGNNLFRIQSSTFLESSTEGSTGARRVIATAPNIVIPEHSSLLIMGELWLIGAGNKDEWTGDTIRIAYWTRRVTDMFRVLTPGEACLGAAGEIAHGSKRFNRETTNNPTDSEKDNQWDIYLSASLHVKRGSILKSGNTLFRVALEYKDLDGFLTCQSDELDEGPVTGTFTTVPQYNPVTDSNTSTTINASVLCLDYWKAFRRISQADAAAYSGDIVVLVPKDQILAAQTQRFSIHSGKHAGNWMVVKVLDSLSDAWELHARRA